VFCETVGCFSGCNVLLSQAVFRFATTCRNVVTAQKTIAVKSSDVTRLRGSIPDRSWDSFSSPVCPERLCGPSNFLSDGYWGHVPCVKRGRDVKLTT